MARINWIEVFKEEKLDFSDFNFEADGTEHSISKEQFKYLTHCVEVGCIKSSDIILMMSSITIDNEDISATFGYELSGEVGLMFSILFNSEKYTINVYEL